MSTAEPDCSPTAPPPMTPPRIALVLGTSTGGVGAHVRSLVLGLRSRGWPVTVCGPAETEELFGFTRVGATFRRVHIAGSATDAPAAVVLRRITGGCALVHAHGLRAGLVGVLAYRRPLVVTWHNAVLAPAGVRRRMLAAAERLVAHGATVNLAASVDLAGRVRSLGGRDVRLAPVALDVARPRRGPDEVRAELGLPAERPLIVCVARLHPQKGLDVLLDAAAEWTALRPEPLVVVAGGGPLEPELRRRITDSGVPVRLLGRRDDVADLLAAADLAVLPSRWEARSLAAQEALQARVPLVATAVGGLPSLLGDGASLVPPDDPSALARAVRELLADPVGRRELAARGSVRADGWPTVADTVGQVEAVYRELVDTPPRP